MKVSERAVVLWKVNQAQCCNGHAGGMGRVMKKRSQVDCEKC